MRTIAVCVRSVEEALSGGEARPTLCDEMGMMRTRRRRGTSGRGWLFLGLVLALGLAGLSRAAEEPRVEAIRLGFGPEAMFRQATWTPAWVDVKSSDPFTGVLELIAPMMTGYLCVRGIRCV